jgi:hypothetical protein
VTAAFPHFAANVVSGPNPPNVRVATRSSRGCDTMQRAQWILLGVAITFLTAATVILAISPIEF